jgi:hypothetical protein
MALIRRSWTPSDADEWTKEDWFAIVLSPLAYIGLAVGVALSVLLLKVGYIVLGATVVLTIILHWVIDPKLKTISEDYEKKQKRYLEDLERIERWEEL